MVRGHAESRLADPQGAEQLLGDDGPRALLTGLVMLIPISRGLGAVTLQNAFLQRPTRPARGWCPLPSPDLGAACAGVQKKALGCNWGKGMGEMGGGLPGKGCVSALDKSGAVLGLSEFMENRIKQVPAFPLPLFDGLLQFSSA